MPELVPTATASLAEALVLFQSALPNIPKDKTAEVKNKEGRKLYSYKYADLKGVTDAALPLLTAVGLAFTSKGRRNNDGTYSLVGTLRHVSGETDEGELPLVTERATAQETGSSITYSRRYLLCSMTGIVPDEDDDGAAAVQAQQRPQNTSQERPPAQDPLDTARQQAFNRHRAVFPTTATRDTFVAAVEAEFAQPFADVTIEQLNGFSR